MEMQEITRAALGRFARFGDFYDARNDAFVGVNGFKDRLTEDDIIEIDANSEQTDFIKTDLLDEKFKKLDINAELSLSIVAGMVKLQGSAAYLNNQKRSSRYARMTVAYSVKTKHQRVDGLKSKVDKDLLGTIDATHIVTEIEWGARCNITCEYKVTDPEDETKVAGSLNAEIEKLSTVFSVKDGASVDNGRGSKEGGSKFSYHNCCDVSDLSKDIPCTFEEAVNVAKELPSVVKATNDGKGIPIKYTLLSLSQLRKICKMEASMNIICKQIEGDIIKSCFKTMEKMDKSRLMLQALVDDLKENQDAFSQKDSDRAEDLLENVELGKLKFISELLDVVEKVRSCKEDVSAISDVRARYLETEYSPERINHEMSKFNSLTEKLKFIRFVKSKNVSYLGKSATVELAVRENDDKKMYIFYMDYSQKLEMPDLWQRQFGLFCRILTAHKDEEGFKFILVDCEFHSNVESKPCMHIEYYERGILDCKDVYAEESADLENCTIKKLDIVDPLAKMPNDRILLEIPCPKSISGKCSHENVQWICQKCKDYVEFGTKTHLFYCQCGSWNHSSATFRCTDVNHGLEYVLFEEAPMTKLLNELRYESETNILILGETGVGKSTWINALANYLAFQTLNDAKESDDMKVLIPTYFSYTTEEGEMLDIKVGTESVNEVLKAGQSATQGPKGYKFLIGKQVITLIDTPGIGDVRGLEQDEKNFESILTHLSYYNEIHGICILLRPNSSRLTACFRFCIVELLTHLHKSASENVVFCFTNARSTFYRPGDTLPVLKKLLSEHKDAEVSITPHNQFCFDNEAFRFLACMKNDVEFNEQDIKTYSSSWDRAVSECRRLFGHIGKLKPHSVRDTISLNNARRMVLELSKPLAETALKIQKNVAAAERKKDELLASDKTGRELADKLYLDAIDLRVVTLEYPRTVCAHAECVRHVQVVDNQTKTVYSQQCHSHCYLSGIPVEHVNDERLLGCWAMDKQSPHNCTICSHSWNVHKHITYDLQEEQVAVIDPNTSKLLQEKIDQSEQLERFIEQTDQYIKELQEEQDKITNTCAKFGCYLSKNAITPYNDHINAHLELLVRQEDQRPDRSQQRIDDLTKMKEQYESEKLVILKAMEHPEESNVEFITDPGEVKKLMGELFKLKHNGDSLKNIFENVHRINLDYQFSETQVAPVRIGKSSSTLGIWEFIKSMKPFGSSKKNSTVSLSKKSA